MRRAKPSRRCIAPQPSSTAARPGEQRRVAPSGSAGREFLPRSLVTILQCGTEGSGTLAAANRDHILGVLRECRWVVGGPNGAGRRYSPKCENWESLRATPRTANGTATHKLPEIVDTEALSFSTLSGTAPSRSRLCSALAVYSSDTKSAPKYCCCLLSLLPLFQPCVINWTPPSSGSLERQLQSFVVPLAVSC
jgi:hypothetical protein